MLLIVSCALDPYEAGDGIDNGAIAPKPLKPGPIVGELLNPIPGGVYPPGVPDVGAPHELESGIRLDRGEPFLSIELFFRIGERRPRGKAGFLDLGHLFPPRRHISQTRHREFLGLLFDPAFRDIGAAKHGRGLHP